MKTSIIACLLLLGIASIGSADMFTGDFSGLINGQRYQLRMVKQNDGSYIGTLSGEGQTTQIKGFLQNDNLIGSIAIQGVQYPFIAGVRNHGELYFQDQYGDTTVFQPVGGTKAAPGTGQPKNREVYINRIKMDEEKVRGYETAYKVKIEGGRYWYDAKCGAWGVENGPTVGFIVAGMDLPQPMPADISGKGTDIFINGREIHDLDKKGFVQLFGVAYVGRYWMDSQGNLGKEGGAAIVNVFEAIRMAQQRSGSVTHGYGSTYGARGTLSSDGGGGHIYSGRTASGKSVFWYPGM